MLHTAMAPPIVEKEQQFLNQTGVYQQILDAIADMVLVKGKDSRILWANRAFCDYYGMSNEQLRDLIDASFNEVDYTAQYVRDDAHVYDTGEVLDIPEEPVTRHDGLVQIFHTVKSPILDPEGHVLLTVGVSRNITEQKRAKEDLQRHQQHLEHIVDQRTGELSRLNRDLSTILASLTEGIVAINEAGRIQRVNPAAESLMGSSTAELFGKSFSDGIVFETEAEGALPGFDWRVLTKSSHPVEGYLLTPNKQRLLVSIQALPLADGGDRPSGAVLVIRDIALQREVTNQRLRQQKLESLGLLAGGIAHDFNNILAGILGNISIARIEAHRGNDLEPLLEQAERACQRAQSLTRQLLTFARGGAPVKKNIDILGIVREAAELALAGSQSRLEMTTAPHVSNVMVDEGQLAQVINNLVINANQAMPGGGQVTVHVGNSSIAESDRTTLPPGNYVKITVRDHGVGILPEHLERIFDPYFTTKSKGNGLGLASVHSIMKQHDGHVIVASHPPNGAQFSLYLPAVLAETGTPKAVSATTKKGQSMRVLVLDDDDGVRNVMRSMLSMLGHDPTVVGSSAEAFASVDAASAENRPFALILVDLTMPGDLSGKEVIERLRARDAQTKIVVMSGYSTDPIMSNYREYGLTARLQKPFTLAEVRALLP